MSVSSKELVARWLVELSDKKHVIEFEHGTLSGKRVIWLDGKELYRKDFLFELVGSITFTVLKRQLTIHITANALNYEYTLMVDGMNLEKFTRLQNKVMRAWTVMHEGIKHRVVLEKDTLDVWVDGTKVQTEGEFEDEGTKTHFRVATEPAYLQATSSGSRKEGIVHSLFFRGVQVPLNKDDGRATEKC